jgi:GAF domain-containing protein
VADLNVDDTALASSLRRLSDRGPTRAGLRSYLQAVVDACVELFDVGGSGLMIADEHSELRYAVATDGPGRMLERVQLETGQGPCVDTFVHDNVVLVEDLAADRRYPIVARELVPRGVASVLGAPVHLAGLTVGSLDVYRHEPYHWDASDTAALTRYADVVEATLTAAVAAESAGELAAQLKYAVEHRVPIDRGVGYLMARDRIDSVAAFNRLRQAARQSRRKVGDVAVQLLDTGHLPQEKP